MTIEYKVYNQKLNQTETRIQEFKGFSHFRRYIEVEAFRGYWLVPNSFRIAASPRKEKSDQVKDHDNNKTPTHKLP